jgi:hypothetical protein
MSDRPNRPVDMSDSFKKDGWEYCKYLITDPRSDAYMRRSATEQLHQDMRDASSKLETPQQEGAEEDS